MLALLLGAPAPSPSPVRLAPSASAATPLPSVSPAATDPVTWADALEARSTAFAAVVALAAAIATIWLLIHQIRETNRARKEAAEERTTAAADRELARREREDAARERRNVEMAQARLVTTGGHFEMSLNGFARGQDGKPTKPGIAGMKTTVQNLSQAPVFQVEVLVAVEGIERQAAYVSVLPANSSMDIDSATGEDRSPDDLTDLLVYVFEEIELSSLTAHGDAKVLIRFVDASGRRWERSGLEDPRMTNVHAIDSAAT